MATGLKITIRRLHNEELHNLYTSLYFIMVIISRWMRWAGHVVRIGKMSNLYKIFLRNPEGNRPPRRTRRRCKDNIIMLLREIGWEVVDWIYLAQDRECWQAVASVVMSLHIPYKAGNFLTVYATINFPINK
jgi:hypothetical protein